MSWGSAYLYKKLLDLISSDQVLKPNPGARSSSCPPDILLAVMLTLFHFESQGSQGLTFIPLGSLRVFSRPPRIKRKTAKKHRGMFRFVCGMVRCIPWGLLATLSPPPPKRFRTPTPNRRLLGPFGIAKGGVRARGYWVLGS